MRCFRVCLGHGVATSWWGRRGKGCPSLTPSECVCSLLFANPLPSRTAAVFYSTLSRPQLTESQTGAPRSPAPQLTAPVPTWCGWGMLWLAVAQSTIRFRVFGRGAAFLGVNSTPHSFSLPCGRAGRPVGPGAAGVALSWYFYPSAHGSAHAVDGMALCRLLAQTVAVSLVSSLLPRCELCRLVVVVIVINIVVLICSWYRMGRQRPYCCGSESRIPRRESGHAETIRISIQKAGPLRDHEW